MENQLLVSVIIPNYNHSQFLDERIQSVLNQTYQNFEVIILDDCSPDNGASKAVIEKYRNNPHVSQIIYNEVNSGSTFKQWHKGFELAKGELVWIAESDDACDVSLLETLVNGYVDNNCVIAFCRSCKYDHQGRKIGYSHQDVLEEDVVMKGGDFISRYMVNRNVVANASAAIFDRRVALAIDKQYMTMRGEGDWLVWIEIMEHGNVLFVSQELNFFRFHNQNTTKLLKLKGVGYMEHKIVFDYLVKKNHILSQNVWKERLRFISKIRNRDEFESKTLKRKALNVWDRYRIWRICLFFYRIISEIYMFVKTIW